MTKFWTVVTVALFSCGTAFSQSTNIVGSGVENIDLSGSVFDGSGEVPTNYAAHVENVATLDASDASFDGGDSGSVDGTGNFFYSGGAGLQLADVGSADFDNSNFQGGQGGEITSIVSPFSETLGGHGVTVTGNFSLEFTGDVQATGGNGGTINNEDGRAKSFGGNGVNIGVMDIAGDVVISNGTFQGGTGGIANYDSSENLTSVIERVDGRQNGARGGHGLYLFQSDMYRDFARSLTITDGTFVGGNGGTAENADASGDAIATGGSGIFVGSVQNVQISGGTFVGGQAGITNGASAVNGKGATFWDSNVDISGGDFQGSEAGLLFASYFYDSALSISGGTFENIEILTIDGAFLGSLNVNVTGGDTGDILLNAEVGNDITADFSGGQIGDLTFGSMSDGNISVTFGAGATNSGTIAQMSGIVDFEGWSDHHFNQINHYGGTMNFNNQTFQLEGEDVLSLMSVNSTANFSSGFIAQSNSSIRTVFDGTTSPMLTGTFLTFEEGMLWSIDGGTNVWASGQVVNMANSALITNNLDVADVTAVGSGASWLGSIIDVTVVGSDLQGTYGIQRFDDAIGVDPSTPFGQAMETLSDFTGIDTSADSDYVGIKDPSLSAQEGENLLHGAFSSPEVASTLIQLQGVLVDQSSDRVASMLRNNSSAISSPEGANGPRHAVDVPPGYGVWARGFGSFLNQGASDGFGGYEATIGGVALGADKKFNNVLLGLGGGYANTRLNGNWGSNGRTDTAYGMLYGAWASDHTFVELSGNYAFNDVTTDGDPRVGDYHGEFDANTASLYLGGGVGFETFSDSVILTPEASILMTYYDREAYTDYAQSTDGAWPDKVYSDYDQTTYFSSLGLTASKVDKLEAFNLGMEFQPELRAHWIHDFNAEMDNEEYIMAGTPQEAVLQARDEDLIKLGAGVRFASFESESLEFGLDLDVLFGEDYEAYIGSAKLLHRF